MTAYLRNFFNEDLALDADGKVDDKEAALLYWFMKASTKLFKVLRSRRFHRQD